VILQFTNDTIIVTAFQNPEHFGRFCVWKDKVVVIQPPPIANDTGATGGVIQQGVMRSFKMNLTFKKPITINYKAAGSGFIIVDSVDNFFYIIANSSSTSLGATLFYFGRAIFSKWLILFSIIKL